VGRVFSEYFDFPCQLPFQQLLHIHYSSYFWHCMALILTVLFNNQLKKNKASLHLFPILILDVNQACTCIFNITNFQYNVYLKAINDKHFRNFSQH
jgi:hypothetical protein